MAGSALIFVPLTITASARFLLPFLPIKDSFLTSASEALLFLLSLARLAYLLLGVGNLLIDTHDGLLEGYGDIDVGILASFGFSIGSVSLKILVIGHEGVLIVLFPSLPLLVTTVACCEPVELALGLTLALCPLVVEMIILVVLLALALIRQHLICLHY